MEERLFLFGCEESYFFRDGTPFTAGEDIFLSSGFPPSGKVIQGAVRTALLSGHGVDFDKYYEGYCNVCQASAEDCLVLRAVGSSRGGGEDMELDFIGPFVTRTTNGTIERLYQAPYDLVQLDGQGGLGRLTPSSQAVLTDLGPIFLPQTDERCRSLTEAWIREGGLLNYLRGETVGVNKVYSWSPGFETFLFREERLGIARCRETRAAQGGMLYAIQHVRLEAQFGLGVRVRGCPDVPLPSMVKLGGEGRLSSLTVQSTTPVPREGIAEAIDEGPGLFGERGFKVVCLSPMRLGDGWLPEGFTEVTREGGTCWEGVLGGITCSLVSMCTGRPVRIGGWDIALRRPKPRLAYMPVGTVYYFTTRHSGAEVVEALHDRKIGFDTKIGFGHIVVGRW
jgi:CRISPR-associated protein Cmr3